MTATPGRLPRGRGWAFEVEWTGRRALVVNEPGLSFKLPFFENVEDISKQVLTVEGSQQELLTNDQKRVLVDYFARYQIFNPLLFYQSVGTVAGANA